MEDKTVGMAILVVSVLALGFVFYVNTINAFDFLSNPVYGEGLGNLCSSEDGCREFCSVNRGRCNEYCLENPSNTFCAKLFGG